MNDMRLPKIPPRERLLEAAAELFYSEGVRGIGVEAIAKKAQTTKMGLYRHFESKDALITEWIKQVICQYRGVLDDLETRYPDDPRKQLLGFAQFIADDLARASHRGCPFINTIAELPEENHPARLLIQEHKSNQVRRLAALCRRAGIANANHAAVQLSCVLEGAQIIAQNRSVENIGRHMMKTVHQILDGQ